MASQQVSFHLEPWRFLPGKVVMVTGASSGLARQFCLDLAGAGCKIIAAARRVDLLHSLCEEINQLKLPISSSSSAAAVEAGELRAVALELDVSADGPPTIEKSVQKAWEAFGFIDALINNAGVRGNVFSSLELPEEEWDQVLRTNLKGSWLVSKYVGRHMSKTSCGGSIINISSIAGIDRGETPGGVAYSSSKSGVNTMTKVMAVELGVHNIRVNTIAPGLRNHRGAYEERLAQQCANESRSIADIWFIGSRTDFPRSILDSRLF